MNRNFLFLAESGFGLLRQRERLRIRLVGPGRHDVDGAHRPERGHLRHGRPLHDEQVSVHHEIFEAFTHR